MQAKVKRHITVYDVIKNVFLWAFSLICLIPFLLLIISSLTEDKSIMQYGYSFFPKDLSLDAYRYLLSQGGEHLSPELLCSNKLLILKQYDEKNKTELYRTLRVYLELERNVLQTAKTLFIHRSTLFYRLERIQKLADVDYEDARERLVLQLSFQILEQRIV